VTFERLITVSHNINANSYLARLPWVSIFGLTVSVWLALGAAFLFLLQFTGHLAAPPLTATACIDEKISFLRNRDLSQVRIMAAGSSATWRNLDMAAFGLDPARALNAAPCFLHIDQTDYFVNLLMEMMPNLQSVITVVAPRDFESCSPQETQIFEPVLGSWFLKRRIPAWVPFIINMKSTYLLKTALSVSQERASGSLAFDDYGGSPMTQANSWRPALGFDERCFTAFEKYSRRMAERGTPLVIATIPIMPNWADTFDRRTIDEWANRLKALAQSGTRVIDGREISFRSEQFADPVHLLSPFHKHYSRFIVQRLGLEH
jgi:hypothetical protein